MNSFFLQRGVAIYLALVILTILLAIALGLSVIVFGQIYTARFVGYSVVALYAADSGLERELYEKNYLTQSVGYTYAQFFNLDGDGQVGSGTCPTGIVDLDDACVQVTIRSLSPIMIDSAGYYKEVRRTLRVEF